MANLYLYRDGSVRFVAALNEEAGSDFTDAGHPERRPHGVRHRSKVTAYDNQGHAEMYRTRPTPKN